MYLPDTNIVILALKGHQPEAHFLEEAIWENELAISAVVVTEFYVKANSRERIGFNLLVDGTKFLAIDREIAQIAGDYRKEFLRKSKRSYLTDGMLAAQAKVHDLTLVTNNKVDFPMRDIKIITP